jgi:hypothetical protein
MKRLFVFASLLLLSCLSPAEENAVEMSMPVKVGRPTWSMRQTAYRSKPTDAWKGQEVILVERVEARTALERPKANVTPRELKVRRDEVEGLVGLLNKFTEWKKVAKTNAVRDFTKDIGVASKYYGETLVFSVVSGQYYMQTRPSYGTPLTFTENDVLDMLALLNRLGDLDAALSQAQAPGPTSTPGKNPTDDLFK